MKSECVVAGIVRLRDKAQAGPLSLAEQIALDRHEKDLARIQQANLEQEQRVLRGLNPPRELNPHRARVLENTKAVQARPVPGQPASGQPTSAHPAMGDSRIPVTATPASHSTTTSTGGADTGSTSSTTSSSGGGNGTTTHIVDGGRGGNGNGTTVSTSTGGSGDGGGSTSSTTSTHSSSGSFPPGTSSTTTGHATPSGIHSGTPPSGPPGKPPPNPASPSGPSLTPQQVHAIVEAHKQNPHAKLSDTQAQVLDQALRQRAAAIEKNLNRKLEVTGKPLPEPEARARQHAIDIGRSPPGQASIVFNAGPRHRTGPPSVQLPGNTRPNPWDGGSGSRGSNDSNLVLAGGSGGPNKPLQGGAAAAPSDGSSSNLPAAVGQVIDGPTGQANPDAPMAAVGGGPPPPALPAPPTVPAGGSASTNATGASPPPPPSGGTPMPSIPASGTAAAAAPSTSPTPAGTSPPSPASTIDSTPAFDHDHFINADFNRRGEPSGGHSLVNGDVRVIPGTESPPNPHGVYEASVEMRNSSGVWLPKLSNRGTNTMFPRSWTADRIRAEVQDAWTNPSRVISADGKKWRSVSPSGVVIEGYINPNRKTAYPVF